ncbi:MAG TPA: DUF4384 domain-containing protein, partial [Bryobacteraceae bacterium]|nr:DUF4384 domain-containing protein [Bryobacteraceae bacterium]
DMKPVLALVCLAGALAAQQGGTKSQVSHRMEITLERQQGAEWLAVDPGFVFEKGDRLRFGFRANFDGYLYVMDYGTSGRYSLLFPREETGQDNRIETGKEYRIPATESWFRVDGPPGHDLIYWLASPMPLSQGGTGLPALPKDKQPPKTLLPRCDDSIFRARGLCIDSSAGLRAAPETEDLPENLRNIPGARSRELIIVKKGESTVVSSPVRLTGPVLYEFRLAHK